MCNALLHVLDGWSLWIDFLSVVTVLSFVRGSEKLVNKKTDIFGVCRTQLSATCRVPSPTTTCLMTKWNWSKAVIITPVVRETSSWR